MAKRLGFPSERSRTFDALSGNDGVGLHLASAGEDSSISMQQRISDSLRGDMRSKTVLDHVRPTVVVRRRIYDPAQFHDISGAAAPTPEEPAAVAAFAPIVVEPQIFERSHALLPTQSWGAAEEDDSGPPSSVNVARALASLRSDELLRVEELIRRNDEDDEEPPTSSVIAPPVSLSPISLGPVSRAPLSTAHVQLPTVRLPRQIALPELAGQMSITPEELVMALVTHGFFTVAQSSILARDTARLAADMFGWQTIDMTDEEDAEHAKRHATPRKRASVKQAKKKTATKRK